MEDKKETSLLKSSYFFYNFLGESLLRFIFDWDSEQRLMVREVSRNSISISKSLGVELEEDIQKSFHFIEEKIHRLDSRLEKEKGSYPTDTLRDRLKDTIHQITTVLAKIDEVDKGNTASSDELTEEDEKHLFEKMEHQRKVLVRKREALERRLDPYIGKRRKSRKSGLKDQIKHRQVLKSDLSSGSISAPVTPAKEAKKEKKGDHHGKKIDGEKEKIEKLKAKSSIGRKRSSFEMRMGSQNSRSTKATFTDDTKISSFFEPPGSDRDDPRKKKKPRTKQTTDESKPAFLSVFDDKTSSKNDEEANRELYEGLESLANKKHSSPSDKKNKDHHGKKNKEGPGDDILGLEESTDLLNRLEGLELENIDFKDEEFSIPADDVLRELGKLGSTESSSSSYDSDSDDSSTDEESSTDSDEDMPLLKDFAVKLDINRAGLKRAKKSPIQMEDACFVFYPFKGDEDKGLFGVADGHAGKKCSEDTTRILPKEFLKLDRAFTKNGASPKTDYTDIFYQLYSTVDEKLKEKGHEYEGATSTTALLWKVGDCRYLQCGNVGDSTAFLIRDEKAIQLTEDHRPTLQSERDRIKEELGQGLNPGQTRLNGIAVSRALGDHFPKEMKIGLSGVPFVTKPIKLRKTDSFLFVASDGLWDILSGQHCYQLIKDKESVEEMAEFLVKTAMKNKKCNDNISVIVVRLRDT